MLLLSSTAFEHGMTRFRGCSGVLAVQLLCCWRHAAQERRVSEDARYGPGGGGVFGGLAGGGFGG
jgi:hypothetical protein